MVNIPSRLIVEFYLFIETSIPDVAIEHRGYIYNQDQTSSITCRSQIELDSIQPLEVDQGCRRNSEELF